MARRTGLRLLGVAAVVLGNAVGSAAHAQEAVLYVTEAQADRVAAYRLHNNGRVSSSPFDRIYIGAGSNPRRLAVHPDACALYVATANRVEVFQIGARGKLNRFDTDEDTLGQMQFTKPANFQFLAVHPRGHALYAAAAQLDQIHQYNLNADGSLARAERDPPIASCVQGVQDVRYQGLAATDTHLYASAHLPFHVEIFPLQGETGAITSCLARPDEPAPECGAPNEESTPQAFDCEPDRPDRDAATFAPDFSRGVGDPKTLLLDEDDGRHTLYIVDRFNFQIYACPIDPDDGGLPDCPRKDKDDENDLERVVLKTGLTTQYEQLALSVDRVLFASIFQTGTVRAFVPKPEKKRLKRRKKKASDVFATPVGLAAYRDTLYVAQGELDRVDALKINARGFKKTKPRWSTDKVKGAFPNGVLAVELNTDPAACGRGASVTGPSATRSRGGQAGIAGVRP